ncbi:MAG: TolC family protein [Prevotellaceae bacterium]|jgi:outer membrane protein|nr:TolC family protein [Prevotellaceae bacterium]
MKKYFILLLSGMLLAGRATGQDWSLEQCIRYALDNNIAIQQQQLTAEQAGNLLFQSKMTFLPSLNANLSSSLSWGMSKSMQENADGTLIEVQEHRFSQSFSPSIYASVNLFEGLKKINTVRRNRSNYQASQQEVERLRNEIALSVAQAYLQVLLSTEVLAVAESSYESIDVQLTRLKQLVEAGSRPYSEQLEMEAQLAAEEVQRVTSKNQLDNNYLNLRQLLDIPPSSTFQIAKPELSVGENFEGEDADNVYSLAQDLPQVKGAEYRMESARHELWIARGNYWPTLSLGGSYGSAYYDSRGQRFWDQLVDNRSPSLNFGLSIPIFNNWSIRTNAKNAKLNLHIAQLEVENKRKTLYKEIQSAITDALAAFNKYKAAERNVIAAKESFRYTEQKFEVGAISATDYNISKNNLLKAQSEELQTKYQYIFQLKIIDFYKGADITL